MDALYLVQYVDDGSFWLHDLADKTMYLGEKMFNDLYTEGGIDEDIDLKSGHWCIINSLGAGK